MNVMVKLSLDVNASTMSGKGDGLARQLGAELLQFARWRELLGRGSNSLLQFSVVYCGVFFGELVNLTARNTEEVVNRERLEIRERKDRMPDGVWTRMRSPERVDRVGRGTAKFTKYANYWFFRQDEQDNIMCAEGWLVGALGRFDFRWGRRFPVLSGRVQWFIFPDGCTDDGSFR